MFKKEYYTVREVAKQLSVSRQTIYKWISENKLKAVRFNETVRIHYTELERLGVLGNG